jgi:hypothetical protein
MPLSRIRVQTQDPNADSLTLALQALLHWAGGETPYRDLNAALGLSWMISVGDPTRCLASWRNEGHDAFLVQTAAAFGIRLRELHPPEAALGLEETPEFAQHFDASYKPLIERALEHGQPVLARSGWGGDPTGAWGVITTACVAGVGFRGTTTASGGEPVTLTAPAVQAYVVEEIQPRVPPDGELWRLAVGHACVVLRNQLGGRFGLTTGPDAYQAWLERLRHEHVCAVCREQSAKCHRALAGAVIGSRAAAVEFLSHHRAGVPQTAHPLLERIAAECDGVIQALARSGDENVVQNLLETPEGRAELADEVALAQAHDVRLRDHVAELSRWLTGCPGSCAG